jgi:hypothetical protein
MATTPNPDDLIAHRPEPNPAGADDPDATYWIEDGSIVCRGNVVRHADRDTFVFFTNGFAKDARACYGVGRRIVGADPVRFQPLNYTYVTDGDRVWCTSGEVKGVNARHFRVCDDGRYDLGNRRLVPHGYGIDDTSVFFYNFDGKAHVVRGADPGTFQSLGDGIFGLDQVHVFVDGRRHRHVQRASWRKIGHQYNTDGRAVFFGDLRMEDVDLGSFRVMLRAAVPSVGPWTTITGTTTATGCGNTIASFGRKTPLKTSLDWRGHAGHVCPFAPADVLRLGHA